MHAPQPGDVATEAQLADLAAQLGVDRKSLPSATAGAAEEAPLRDFRLWSEHLPAKLLFDGCSTQWRRDQGMPYGLDYAGVRASPAFHALPAHQREQAMADLQSIEQGWLQGARQRSQQPPAPPTPPGL